ncbi:MAG: hypothetical protein WCL07_00615 [bacterium]
MIKQKLLTTSILALLSLWIAPTTFAQSASPAQSIIPRGGQIHQEIGDNVAELHANRLENHFNTYYTRLKNIWERLHSHIILLGHQGKDVTSVQVKLSAAILTLESAKTKGIESVAAFRAIDPSKFSEQKDKVFIARDLAEESRKLYKQAQIEMVEAISVIKDIKGVR